MWIVFNDPVNDIAGQSVVGGDPVKRLCLFVEKGEAAYCGNPNPAFWIFEYGGRIVIADAFGFITAGPVLLYFVFFAEVMVNTIGGCYPYIAPAVLVYLPDKSVNIIPGTETFRLFIVNH